MSIEELNKKLEYINNRLSLVISDMYAKYDSAKLLNHTNALQREILGDKFIQMILVDGTPELREKYIEVIENAAIKVRQQLKSLQENEYMDAHKDEIENIANNSNEGIFNVAYSLREMEEVDFSDITSEAYMKRIEDLEDKNQSIDSVLKIYDKVELAKNELKIKGKPDTIDEIKKQVEAAERARKVYLNEYQAFYVVNKVNFGELVDELDNLLKDSSIKPDDPAVVETIKKIKTACYKYDEVYDVGVPGMMPKFDLVNTFKKVPTSKGTRQLNTKDEADLNNWVKALKSKINNPIYEGILNENQEAKNKFLATKIEKSKNSFNAKLDRLSVIKVFVSENRLKLLKDRPLDAANIKVFEELEKSLDNYKRYVEENGLDKDILKVEKENLSKKLEAYNTIFAKINSKIININGKSIEFENDMTNPDVDEIKYDEYLKYIEQKAKAEGATADDKKFKEELDSFAEKKAKDEMLALGITKPKDRWYHKFLSFITFRRYATPTEKYEYKFRKIKNEKATEKIKLAISENKVKTERYNEAIEIVNNDNKRYKKEIAKKTIATKTKVNDNDKKEAKRNLDNFTR